MENPLGPYVDDQRHESMDMVTEASGTSGVVTLKPYTPRCTPSKPLPQRNRRKFSRKSSSEIETLPGVFEHLASYEKYLTFKLAEDKRAQELDMFEANREITDACGREPDITIQSDGTLLIEAISSEESRKLQALSLLN